MNILRFILETALEKTRDFLRNLNCFTQLSPKKGWWHTRLRKISDLRKKLKSKSEFEIVIGLVAKNPEKNSKYLRNLRFE